MGSAAAGAKHMPFRKKKKKREQPERSNLDVDDYEQAITNGLRSIRDTGGYAYSPRSAG